MRQMGEMKKVWRFFSKAEYESEEKWINEMAKEGWNLTAVGFCRYIFRRGTPGEYIYKVDVVERTASDEVSESYFNFYLPFFKLIPELKFCFGLADILVKNRKDLTDMNMLKYTQSLDKASSRMVVLTFYFE